MKEKPPAAKLSEQWTCADKLPHLKNEVGQLIRRHEICNADRLNFEIVPNRHQTTDFFLNNDRSRLI